MKVFDNSEFDYQAEVQRRWGETDAYKEHKEKTKNYSKDQWNVLGEGMGSIFADFAACMKSGAAPDSARAQTLVGVLVSFIGENYYTCTKEILSGLGQMYVTDERFQNNIDKCGEGTAEFVSKAIELYTQKK